MNESILHAHPSATSWRKRLAFTALGAMVTLAAQAQLSQRPLLVGSSGVAPNIMVSLDNSSSMADAFDDAYQTRWDGVRAADLSGWNGTDQATNPQHFWSQRSAEINTMYYNPRITYLPRVDENNVPLVPTDGIVFVSNAASARREQQTFARSVADLENGGPTVVVDLNFPDLPPKTAPAGWIQIVSSNPVFRTPVHQPHAANGLDASTPPFTYVTCKTVGNVYFGSIPIPTCLEPERIVDVRHDASDPIPLPSENSRTDCQKGATLKLCTPQEEVTNIINWYRYYGTRIKATQTALGQAFHSDKLKDGLARIGYRPLTLRSQSGMPLLGHDASKPHGLRGVRPWRRNTPEHKQFFDWLYGTYLQTGTPLLKAYAEVGNYFSVKPGSVENPWARNPAAMADAGNPELSCRRSYHLMLSDVRDSRRLGQRRRHCTDGERRRRNCARRTPEIQGRLSDQRQRGQRHCPAARQRRRCHGTRHRCGWTDAEPQEHHLLVRPIADPGAHGQARVQPGKQERL